MFTAKWFPVMYSQKWNCYFENTIIMCCLPVPTLTYLWEIYIFPGSVFLFCCREICGAIQGVYKYLTDTWIWKLGVRPRNSQKRNTYSKWDFPCSVYSGRVLLPFIRKGDDFAYHSSREWRLFAYFMTIFSANWKNAEHVESMDQFFTGIHDSAYLYWDCWLLENSTFLQIRRVHAESVTAICSCWYWIRSRNSKGLPKPLNRKLGKIINRECILRNRRSF